MSRERNAGGRSASGGSFSLAAFLLALIFAHILAHYPVRGYSSEQEKEQTRQESQKQESEEPVYDVGPGVTPPRVVRQVPPKYSGSRGVRVVGSVTISLVVTAQGFPKDPQVVKSLDKDVDQSALDAVRQWRFDPARKDGKPVAVRIALEIDFHSL
jgi:TonB family protein